MSRTKNPTLRRRTRELSECAEDARECQLLGYELKDLGSLFVKMAIHMEDLQRKVDSQAEYIKTLNADRKTEPQYDAEEVAKDIKRRVDMVKKEWDVRHTETNVETMSCQECKHWDIVNDHCCFIQECRYEPKTEPQTDYRIIDTIGYKCPKCGRGNFLNYEDNCVYCGEPLIKDEPQTETSTNGRKVQLTDCAWAAPDAPRTVPLYPMKEGEE